MFNPERPNQEEAGQEAESLEKKLSEKSFAETYISEYSTRKSKTRGAEAERGPAFRFERGQIYKAYKILRKEIQEAEKKGESAAGKKGLLKEIRGRAKEMEGGLDELNEQLYKNVKDVEIETEFGKFTIPVCELDLKKDAGQEEDARTPYFLLGGIATQQHQNAALAMGMALGGHKVYIPMQPEQPYVKKPDNFGEMLRKQGDFKIHAEIAKQVIKKMGIKDFNLIGYSAGTATALEMASDPSCEGIKDLTIVEPLGLEEKGIARLAREFGIGQALLKTFPYSEARTKTFVQGADVGQGEFSLFLTTASILSKKLFTPEKLKAINPKGRFQVWMGTNPIIDEKAVEGVFGKTEQLRQEQNPDASPLEFYKIKGGDHGWPMTNALGFFRIMTGPKPKEQVITVKIKDLENSAVAHIIKDIKKENE